MPIRSMMRIRNHGIRIAFSTIVRPAITNSSRRDSETAIVIATMPSSSDCTPNRRMAVKSAFWPTIR